jgi:hypothetical protein
MAGMLKRFCDWRKRRRREAQKPLARAERKLRRANVMKKRADAIHIAGSKFYDRYKLVQRQFDAALLELGKERPDKKAVQRAEALLDETVSDMDALEARLDKTLESARRSAADQGISGEVFAAFAGEIAGIRGNTRKTRAENASMLAELRRLKAQKGV